MSRGWDAAIHSNTEIPRKRQQFLISRREYWEAWSRSQAQRSIIRGGDEE
jgi:hypothetical protein